MTDIKIPTPEEVEKAIIEKDRTAKTTDPLDSHATFFYLYIFRFKNQTKLMSKKQLIKLVATLTGSEYTNKEEANKLVATLDKLNLNSIIRVVNNTVEFPLNEKEIKSMSKNEKKAFDLMDNLLAEKYVKCLEQITDISKVKTVQDIIKHNYNEKEFNKRLQVEKDAFSTANQLVATKTLLIQYTVLEQLKLEEDKKGDSNVGSDTKNS